ncbi:DNA repair and recombination protein RadB [Methanohalophilus sp.]|uniref:DNA repair and recombination protein RadB n=1 Tax=Methanohalophilus sp. TaxID=1966352 RepID=UPI00262E9533|nr:DNA repair and recombination protein RadB [Methanohalophilus sp.]MDK2891615.1 repair protein RadB [Methanohalophilus sp.]
MPEVSIITGKLLKSGCVPLDEMLGGGFEAGIITQVFGEAGSGKTNLCLQLAVKCVNEGKRVVYVDTEALSPERFRQIAGENAKNIAQNIIIYEPHSFEEQYSAIREIEKISAENIGLIIVDSATSYYRFGLEDQENSIRNRRELANQIGYLHSLARKRGIVVLITNQVYSDIQSGELKPIGGSTIGHMSKTIIEFKREEKNKRSAVLRKHRSRPDGISCEFSLTEEGIK